jgi:hypothetical protein
MKRLLFFILAFASVFADSLFEEVQDIVLENRRIYFEEYPEAFNPSIVRYQDGYLMTFRYTPQANSYVSYIGVVLLNSSFEKVSKPDLLLTRHRNSVTQSQSEDARLFYFRDRLYVIYNDNIEMNNPSIYDRRDIFIAEVFYAEGRFCLSAPLKLFCNQKSTQLWQKNWVPFEWNQVLYLSYSLNPHEVLYVNLISGECYSCYTTSIPLDWDYGSLRGSSGATLVDGEYFAFFHSGKVMASPASYNEMAWHYFMGAYTFSKDPPFQISKVSSQPIVGDGFYDPSMFWKKVIFPGGYVIDGSQIHVAYGKNDAEIWIATLDKEALMASMVDCFEKTEINR